MNINALRNYSEAQLLGQPHREKAIQKVRDGIACFESLQDALCDAEENIQRYTKSDFQKANFYEVVRDEVLLSLSRRTNMAAEKMQIGGIHYANKKVQPWHAMEAWMTREQFVGFLRGNAIKYLARCDDKGGIEDLKKARHYLDKLIEFHELSNTDVFHTKE